MVSLKIRQRNGKVQDLSPAALDAYLVDKYTTEILHFNLKFKRAKNKIRKMEYKQMVSHLTSKLAELNVDTSIKLSN